MFFIHIYVTLKITDFIRFIFLFYDGKAGTSMMFLYFLTFLYFKNHHMKFVAKMAPFIYSVWKLFQI